MGKFRSTEFFPGCEIWQMKIRNRIRRLSMKRSSQIPRILAPCSFWRKKEKRKRRLKLKNWQPRKLKELRQKQHKKLKRKTMSQMNKKPKKHKKSFTSILFINTVIFDAWF